MQYIANCDYLYAYFFGLCAFFTAIRLLKVLRLSMRIIVFLHAFKRSLRQLISFAFLFVAVWVGFSQAFYFLIGAKTTSFMATEKALTTGFQIMLGKFEAKVFFDDSTSSDMWLPVALFICFNIFMIFVMICFFVILLLENFDLTRSDTELQRQDPELFAYLKAVCMQFMPFKKRRQIKDAESSNDVYTGFFDSLPSRIDDLMERYKCLYTQQVLNRKQCIETRHV